MQYILTESEYANLIRTKANLITLETARLQELCTKIANEMPIAREWSDDKTPAPWGCIISEKHEWYCDDCPVSKICPNEHKEWSK